MNDIIITQNIQIINTPVENFPNTEKWGEKKIKAKEMAKLFDQLHLYNRAHRMRECAELIRLKHCDSCGTNHVESARLCRDRFCPICTWRLSMRRFANMYTIVDSLRNAYPESSWEFVTLTARNCKPDGLNEMIDEMMRTWNSIASAKKFKEKVAGWARNLEITYNPDDGSLHPHFHILVMYRETEIPDYYIIERWCNGYRGHVSFWAQDRREIGWKVDQNPDDEIAVEAILETYKYSVKDTDLQKMPLRTFRAMVEALNKRRLVAFGGVVKEYAKLCDVQNMDDAGEEDEQQAETKITKCVKCGSRNMIDIVGAWTGNGYLWRRTN